MSRNKKNARKYSKEKENREDYKKKGRGKMSAVDECPAGSKDNDPRWYSADSNLVSDFAKLSFSNAVGYANDIRPTTGTDPEIEYTEGTKGRYITPGLMTLELVPTIGEAFSNNAAVNKGAMDLITQIRSKLGSFTKIYDAPDVMKYILAVDSAQTFYYFMCRLYGLMNLYYVDNIYYPETLIDANNVDFNSIVGQHANEFKGYIDKYANYVSKFPIPANLSLLARHAWLYQNLYTDSDALKPQLYMFVPGQFLKYTETSGSDICLTYEDFGLTYHPNRWTLSDLMTFGNGLLNAIQTSQDLQYIAGDIRKAFGDEMMVPIYQIDQNYVVPQTHSYEILSQIENATAVGKNVTQYIAENYDSVDPNVATGLRYGGTYGSVPLASNKLTTVSTTPQFAGEKILNFHKTDAPTGDDVMVATRLTAVSRTTRELDGEYLGIISAGSEMVTRFWVYNRLVNNSGSIVPEKAFYTTRYYQSAIENLGLGIGWWSAFDWAPQLDIIDKSSDGTHYKICSTILDVANYTVLPSSKLDQIHEVALMSEFGITQTTENKATYSNDKYNARK